MTRGRGAKRTCGSTTLTLSTDAESAVAGRAIEPGRTCLVESTTNCAHVVPGCALPTTLRIGIDAEPRSETLRMTVPLPAFFFFAPAGCCSEYVEAATAVGYADRYASGST